MSDIINKSSFEHFMNFLFSVATGNEQTSVGSDCASSAAAY